VLPTAVLRAHQVNDRPGWLAPACLFSNITLSGNASSLVRCWISVLIRQTRFCSIAVATGIAVTSPFQLQRLYACRILRIGYKGRSDCGTRTPQPLLSSCSSERLLSLGGIVEKCIVVNMWVTEEWCLLGCYAVWLL
jgi:hypothetical protein